MEQELIKLVADMLPKIADRRSFFNEQELVVVKAAFESITGIKCGNMMSCGGQLCEDYRRSIVNYMANYKHVNTEAPRKTVVPKKVKPEPVTTERDSLMAQCLEIAEAKHLIKPHHRAGEDTLKNYINRNK